MSISPSLADRPNAPYSQEAEEAVIGSILINPTHFITVAAFLSPDDFFLLRHNYIWQAFTRLNTRQEPIDTVTIAEELSNMKLLDDIGGPAYLLSLINKTPTAVYAEVYGRIVERTAIRRRMLEVADKVRELAHDEEINIETALNEAEGAIFNLGESQVRREFVPMWEAMSAYYDRIQYMLENKHATVGIPSGFRDLDQLLGGFQRSDLLVFAGRPGMGKCVTGDTLIATTEGMIPIERLKPDTQGIPDDEGGTFYPLELSVQTPSGIKRSTYFYDSGFKPTLKLQTYNGYTLAGTHQHPLMVLAQDGSKRWKRLDAIQPGDKVLTGSRAWETVKSIHDNGIQHCYDLTVPDGQMFVTNGLVSHNTSFLLTTAMNAARFGARVAIFTMEMGVEQMAQRMVAMETGINVQKLRLGQLTDAETSRFVESVGRISNLNIFIDDTPAMSPMEMRTKCRRLQHEHGLDLIMVDYMQLMNAGGGYQNNRVQEITFISRTLKELARELNVPLISAAQLSRAVEQRQDKRPQLSDLRESGCLTGDSFVYLPDCGYSVPIANLMGQTGFRVMSLNIETWQTEPATVTNAFCTGIKPVYRLTTALGRSIRATGNHKFLTIEGWKRLDTLTLDEEIVVSCIPELEQQPPVISSQYLENRWHRHELQNNVGVGTQPDVSAYENAVCTDKIVSIEPDGEEPVYDLTVEPNHNFICENMLVHNSIEQDSDIVMFLYRDEVYNPETTEYPNQADIIIAKHRNGPTGTIQLYFEKALTKFMDASVHQVDLSDLQ